MHVIIQKPDLDTCLTALILQVSPLDEITVVKQTAQKCFLLDPNVICIEAGGSGLTELNNFDHHDPQRHLPPACKQAYKISGIRNSYMERLVQYVSVVDGFGHYPALDKSKFYLSNLFSGFLFCTENVRDQFKGGINLLRQVINYSLDPFEAVPVLPCWEQYQRSWANAKKTTAAAALNMELFQTSSGLLAGFLENSTIGGFGHLYRAGCAVAVLYNSSFGPEGVRKFTIGSTGKDLTVLLSALQNMENGWGGRSTIIGSPLEGSRLSPELVKSMVKKCC